MNNFDLHLIGDAAVAIMLSKSLEYFVIKIWTKIDSKIKSKLDV